MTAPFPLQVHDDVSSFVCAHARPVVGVAVPVRWIQEQVNHSRHRRLDRAGAPRTGTVVASAGETEASAA